ncbi:MAG: hypothetical protein ABWY71_00305 [Candidatus Saccharimonadales bacterium]
MKIATIKILIVSLIAGVILSAASVVHSSHYSSMESLSSATRGFPVSYMVLNSGTACHDGIQARLQSVYENGTCDREMSISRLLLNTLFWSVISLGGAILLYRKKTGSKQQ